MGLIDWWNAYEFPLPDRRQGESIPDYVQRKWNANEGPVTFELTPSTPGSEVQPGPEDPAANLEGDTLSHGRPHLPPPEKLEGGEHSDSPPVSEHAKPEGSNVGNIAQPGAVPQSPRVPGRLDLSESQPQSAKPNAVAAPKGIGNFLKPAGAVLAGLFAIGTLGGVIWAFNKWKNGGVKKEAGKGGKGKKERRHVREWTVLED